MPSRDHNYSTSFRNYAWKRRQHKRVARILARSGSEAHSGPFVD